MQSEDPKEIYAYLAERRPVRYTRHDELLPEMEVKFAKDALDDEQLLTRKKIVLTGLGVFFADSNLNIAFKEHYLKSDKYLEDVRHLRIVLSEVIDEREITRFKQLIDRCRP